MTLSQTALGAVVLLPLVASALSLVLPPAARRWVGVTTAVLILLGTTIIVAAVAQGSVQELALSGHAPPLGIAMRADGLGALFLATTAAVGSLTTLYAAALPSSTGVRLDGDVPAAGHPGFWPLWLGCWAGLNAVFISGDLFNTYVGLELVGLTAVGLVALGGRDSLTAALRYLFVAVAGSLLLLLGVGLLLAVTGHLDVLRVAQTTSGLEDSGPVLLAVGLITLGLALKTALVPLHRWLVPAHAGAPGAVSPLLSGLVIKAALFVLLRCWLWILPETGDGQISGAQVLSWTLAAMGTAALMIGGATALRQDRLKPLVACSTVAQVGYWVLLLPIVTDPRAEGAVLQGALGGTVALALCHAVAKAGLFLAVGTFKEIYGTDEISALRGVGRDHPVLVLSMGLAALGLIGLPISWGFLGKWQLATSGVAAGHFWIVAVLVAGTLLSAAYLLRAVGPLLVEPEADDAARRSPHRRLRQVPRAALSAPLLLGLLTVGTGLLGSWMDQVLTVGVPW
ncbi:complex I subunit 5 family protein [Nesterenkonia xinjiangensis]|uniref:Formate hydrogenlyase subunit 3/multisubunit Na+/H+ antiporter MnhD subunit n=1 Tax=Nesterenkonia xinjiangensis TaxID=225327 RepID=A0A7Z0KBX1_9MICC|nr:proton-conducting transporter membrane subunit [Nesterenkonia xinjiangensis]NYJ78052.1 formate hydrogenlyase subunit 3/multisubunit Na+/H+ antiporter MnhD subunit [Nesterenkonia xinjiangensis]